MSVDPVWLKSRLRLYLVADPKQSNHDLIPAVESALSYGVSTVQLRAKSLSDRDHLALARRLADHCQAYDALFLVNDRVDIALAAAAGGVHLGVHDIPVGVARRLLGDSAVIGYSPETEDETTAAAAGANYVGVGPVFGTDSKGDAGSPIGLDGLRRRVQSAGVPVIGIGGITPESARGVMATGAIGVAVIGAILRSDDLAEATRALDRATRSDRI